ncbi:pilus assembly protein [Jiella marina]|uniref:pilus assembly protein n=1 Tax=Jiella sp. LLJ827 TaxID=2917712 RepID=UPI002100CB13|nr:pilus assembly protein [Jiella sp. LLJ827]MCQ0989312.1 pilus assembly protein [Jiella sp. LLJ827]
MTHLHPPLLVVAACLWLGGCTEYVSQRDTISPTAGQAVATNLRMHVADPQAAYRYNTVIRMDGQAALNAQKRYRRGALPVAAPASAPAAVPAE